MAGQRKRSDGRSPSQRKRPAASEPFLPPLPSRVDPATGFFTRTGNHTIYLPPNAGDFWQWAFSDFRQNSLRGILAEFIVGMALDLKLSVREPWNDFDLRTEQGIRIEVKTAGYLQGWRQQKLSTPTFSGLQARPFPWGTNGRESLYKEKGVKADVFVFCVQWRRLTPSTIPST